MDREKRSPAFEKLVELMAMLRGPEGCPWDRKQTAESLKPFLIEECFEVVDALEEKDPGKVKEELGDLLFQIIFHARVAEEKGEFTMEDVISAIVEKMTRRHPHVFGDEKLTTDREVLAHWEAIKKKEKGYEQRRSILEGVPKSLPAWDSTGKRSTKRCPSSMRKLRSSKSPSGGKTPPLRKRSWATSSSCS
jgi:tetrapyrrole methylase family protein / MazG family protein